MYSSSSKRTQEPNTGNGNGRRLFGSLTLKEIPSRSKKSLTDTETPDVRIQSEQRSGNCCMEAGLMGTMVTSEASPVHSMRWSSALTAHPFSAWPLSDYWAQMLRPLRMSSSTPRRGLPSNEEWNWRKDRPSSSATTAWCVSQSTGWGSPPHPRKGIMAETRASNNTAIKTLPNMLSPELHSRAYPAADPPEAGMPAMPDCSQ